MLKKLEEYKQLQENIEVIKIKNENSEFLKFIKKELNKISPLNDRIYCSFEEYILNEKANFILVKEKSIKNNFNDFAILMREYGIILPYQKILFDFSQKFFYKEK